MPDENSVSFSRARHLPRQAMIKCLPPAAAAFILYNTLSFAILLLEVPLVSLFERSICNRYYRNHPDRLANDVDEALCKVKPVQDLLTIVIGLQLSFSSIPGLLTAVSYGDLAERRGKRLVLFLGTVAFMAMWIWIVAICAMDNIFDVRFVWISAIFLFAGGGERVYNAILYATMSNSVPSSKRTRYFYLMHAGPHINRLVTPRVATVLMQKSIYSPFIVSISLLAASLIVILIMDEKPNEKVKGNSETAYQSLPDSDEADNTGWSSPSQTTQGWNDHAHDAHPRQDSNPISSPTSSSDGSNWFLRSLSVLRLEYWIDLFKTISYIFRPPTALFCLAGFFIKRIAFGSEGFIFQFASEKFSWPLTQTTWLRVSSAVGAILTTLIICPTLVFLCNKRGYNVHQLDLWIVRGCLIVLTASFLLAFVATSAGMLVVAMLGMGLGEGTEPALQGLITHVTDPVDYSRLFTALAQIDTVAELISGPVTAGLMNIGRGDDKPSDGWCFFGSSAMFACLGVWAFFLSLVQG